MFLICAVQVSGACCNITAQGGNISSLNLYGNFDSNHWQGYAGRLNIITPTSPSNVSANAGNVSRQDINIRAPCKRPKSISGYIFFSNDSTMPTGLRAGDMALLNSIMGTVLEGPNKTFTQTTNFSISKF